MAVRVAINGFGRIGRLAFRQMFDAEGYEVVAINDLTNPKMLAHLLKYDSAQGRYEKADTVVAGEDSITVDGKIIKIYAKADANELPWGEIGVDVVLECTGFYTSKDKAMAHINAGAKRVVISAPAGKDLPTVVYNVNQDILTPEDKIIWDVGHQAYVHKILTGRKEEFKTLRKMNGIAGFPKTNESEYDCFNTGHSSTSISAALGMARARDLKDEKNQVIAVIGDGALTGGMALEALNDTGCSNTKMTVILNDNEMSISKNIGGLNMFLSKLRTKKLYTKSNISAKKVISQIPIIGNPTVKVIQRIKRSIKQLIIPKMFFEDIGFTYLGPVDGHDIEQLENIMRLSMQVQGPVLIHVLTKKGKGYKIAEENPDKFHATAPFDIKTGKTISKKKTDYSKIFGDKLIKLAKNNRNIVAITAAMPSGTGLNIFEKNHHQKYNKVTSYK